MPFQHRGQKSATFQGTLASISSGFGSLVVWGKERGFTKRLGIEFKDTWNCSEVIAQNIQGMYNRDAVAPWLVHIQRPGLEPCS